MTRGRKRTELTDAQVALIESLRKDMDWSVVTILLGSGVPQNEIARQLGLSQSWISRKIRHLQGASWTEMDAAQRKVNS